MSREKMIEHTHSALMLGQEGTSCIGHTILTLTRQALCPGLGTPEGSASRKSIKSTFGKLFEKGKDGTQYILPPIVGGSASQSEEDSAEKMGKGVYV
jgi:hypothetical protein